MSVPLRAVVLVLAAIEKLTVPLPVPLAPAVIVIQAALLTAAHGQIAFAAATLTLPVVAATGTEVLYDDKVYEQAMPV